MGLIVKKEKIEETLKKHLEGESLLSYGYGTTPAFTLWLNKFYYLGLTPTKIIAVEVSAMQKEKGKEIINLNDVEKAEYEEGDIESLLALSLKDGKKRKFHFQSVLGFSNKEAAKQFSEFISKLRTSP